MATLLVVDDDTLVRQMLYDLLSETHECHTADRAEQALAYLEVESYDAVLTDVSMPGLGGKEILLRIQGQHPTTPVIIISGSSNNEAAEELLNLGAYAYITKPFRLEDIEETVDRAIARHEELTDASKANNATSSE